MKNKIKIRNFCFGLKNKQINYYLTKLPEIYKTCEVPLLFINKNILGYLIFNFYSWKYNLPKNRNYKEFKIVSGTSYYTTLSHKPVLIYCAKCNKKGSKEFLVFTLFHELRHWYQQKYLTEYSVVHSRYYNDNVEMDNYDKQVLEKDANIFARKHSLKLGIKFIKCKGVDFISYKRSKLKI